MERALVAVFENEKKAFEGRDALLQLDRDASITVYAHAVIVKNSDGTIDYKASDEPGPLGTVLGPPVAGLIAALGGPAAGIVGVVAGLVTGGFWDLDNARVADDFADDVSNALLPHRAALIAEINEDWRAPVDVRLEAFGGIVFRSALSDVRQTMNEEDIEMIKADIAEFKAEAAKANSERKARLHKRVAWLEAKLRGQRTKEEADRSVCKA